MSVAPEQITAVILAGGFGTRIKHLLGDLPKPMASVNGRPFIEWVVRYLAAQGVRRMLISTGYQAEVVERHFASNLVPGVAIRCISELQPLGTGGGVLNAIRASGEKATAWLVLNGDTISFVDIAKGAMALADPTNDGAIYAREVADTTRYGSLVIDRTEKMVRFEEKRPGKGVISTGVYLFRDPVLKMFPSQVPLSLELEVFPALTACGASLKVISMNAPFLDIGTPESLGAATAFIQENLARFEPVSL